jgi:hypothetical protein
MIRKRTESEEKSIKLPVNSYLFSPSLMPFRKKSAESVVDDREEVKKKII